MIEFEPILTAMLTGALYSVVWWSTKRVDPTKPDIKFQFIPLLSTALIGAGVGFVAVYTGSPVTQMSIETQLVEYGSVIAVVERVLSTLYNYLEAKQW